MPVIESVVSIKVLFLAWCNICVINPIFNKPLIIVACFLVIKIIGIFWIVSVCCSTYLRLP